jgi:hypothetical protein
MALPGVMRLPSLIRINYIRRGKPIGWLPVKLSFGLKPIEVVYEVLILTKMSDFPSVVLIGFWIFVTGSRQTFAGDIRLSVPVLQRVRKKLELPASQLRRYNPSTGAPQVFFAPS